MRFVALEPAEVALEAAFGKQKASELAHGKAQFVQAAVVVTLRNFTAEVACDSRSYFAQIELSDLKPGKTKAPPLVASAHGC